MGSRHLVKDHVLRYIILQIKIVAHPPPWLSGAHTPKVRHEEIPEKCTGDRMHRSALDGMSDA